MKASLDAILKREQAEYLDRILPGTDELLAEMEHYAAENRHPIADREVAQLMRVVLRMTQPKRLLEIGTNIGYSVVVMGRECPGATIETIELDDAILRAARRFVQQADLRSKVVFHHGAALAVLKTLDGPFDFVFIDCVKTEYTQYLDEVLPRLADGAVIFCDNLLWGGQVATRPRDESQKASTEAIRQFNEKLMTHPMLMSSIVPVGDGVGLSVFNRR